MKRWIASIGTWDANGDPKYRALHFEAQSIEEAVIYVNQEMMDGEWLYEIRQRYDSIMEELPLITSDLDINGEYEDAENG